VSKFKYDIKRKNLSWEKNIQKICDEINCNEIGNYKAPKSRIKLNEYYYFCIKHIKEYNKSWDFYKGLSVDQIELSMRKDSVWDRPSWPFKGNPTKIIDQVNEFIGNDFDINQKKYNYDQFYRNKLIKDSLSNEENKALNVLELKLPLNLTKIKKKYKKLVKIFHPDVNDNNKEAEDKFKKINESYKILLNKFKK
tara:strand:- start:270 stop:854 length:585 start_codon:yes stop_codon:yes gene_type:complete